MKRLTRNRAPHQTDEYIEATAEPEPTNERPTGEPLTGRWAEGIDAYSERIRLIKCGICGDLAERVDCADRHGWEAHGLCCVGECSVCREEIRDA